MAHLFKLAEAMNTYDPALLVLQEKGYRLHSELGDPDSEWADWIATKDDRQFIATDPLALLGLVAIWEQRGDAWQKKPDEAQVYDKLVAGRIQR